MWKKKLFNLMLCPGILGIKCHKIVLKFHSFVSGFGIIKRYEPVFRSGLLSNLIFLLFII